MTGQSASALALMFNILRVAMHVFRHSKCKTMGVEEMT